MSDLNEKDRLSDYLDGEMSASERTEFEAELKTSESLRLELDRMRRASGQLRNHFQSKAAAAVDDEGCAIAVEQIVRMSTQELRRADIKPTARRSPFMIFALALLVLGLGLILASPFLNNEPSPDELIADAADRINHQVSEFSFSLGPQLEPMLGLIRSRVGYDVEVKARLRIGPGGLAHVLIAADGLEAVQLQAGFDGQNHWFANDPAGPIQRAPRLEDLPENPLAAGLLGVALSLRAALDEARNNPAALELVGRVEDEFGGESWKVHLGGSRARMNGDFWFDDEGQLLRFGIGPVMGVATPNPDFGLEDFQLDRILPGVPIEDVEP